ncbi:MAG: fibronectin type III domain-containing protein [Planctomycetota bacterium]|jgi:hypothetical protein
MSVCKHYLIAIITISLVAIAAPTLSAVPLTVLSANDEYPDDGSGKGVLLTGSHCWGNIQEDTQASSNEKISWSNFLEVIADHDHSFVRGWHWEDAYYTPLPYNKSGSDYNLTSYNTTYSNRWKDRADDLADENCYLGVMLFEGWSVDDHDDGRVPDPWPQHPYKSSNNINGINGDPNSDGMGRECHSMGYSSIRAKQEDYVEWMIDQLNSKDNIVWQISNESYSGSASWQYHMIDHIISYEATKAKQHLVWMENYNFQNSDLFVSNAHILSPNAQNGDTHYKGTPAENTTGRIIVLDTDHLTGVGLDWQWVWKAFTRGYHPIYMDPLHRLSWWPATWDPDDSQYVNARKAMGLIRAYAERLDFSVVVPKAVRASTSKCLSDETNNEWYLAYPSNANTNITIKPLASGTYYYEWVDPVDGTLHETGLATGTGVNKTFTDPDASQQTALYLVEIGDDIEINLDYFNDPRGLRNNNSADGENKGTTIGGRDCRTQTDASTEHYFYCDVDDDWAYQGDKTDVYVLLEYYDTGTGTISIRYDSTSGIKNGTSVTLSNDSTWKTYTWHLTDAYFGNGMNTNADFRIYRDNSAAYYLDKLLVSETDPNPGPPSKATSPSPANAATGQALSVDISWSAGGGATSHDVYFGIDSTPDSSEFKANQSGVTYEPGTLSASTTYYWRIDEVNGYGTTTVDVWSFTTYGSPGSASSPSPANSAPDVSTTADLSWTAGANAESHDVYFGTSSPGTFQGNQSGTTFDPGTMSNSTTYYWRIDEKNEAGTTTGTVWSFTTAAAPSCGSTISVDMGTTDDEDCLARPSTEPANGDTVPKDKGGKNCRRNKTPFDENLFFYFCIDDDWAYGGNKSDVYISIDYYVLSATSFITLHYDAGEGTNYKNAGQHYPSVANSWREHTWHLTDADFSNRQAEGADFRIKRGGELSLYLDIVDVYE